MIFKNIIKKTLRLNHVKLVMCILVKDEEDVIEHCLNFNKLMGVDGFIVTDNNSSDGTRKILEKYKQKGWIYEIINEQSITYYQREYCDRMIKLAIKKYKATWVISSDADEFWYSEEHDLKQSILRNRFNDILYVNMLHLMPPYEKRKFSFEELVKDSYYRWRDLTKEEIEFYHLNSPENTYKLIINTKCVFKSSKYKKINYGNHNCQMKFLSKVCHVSNIKLFHLGIRGYDHFVRKVTNFAKAWENHPKADLTYYPRLYKEYIKTGRADEIFEKLYLFSRFEELKEECILIKDLSLYIFLKSKNYFDKSKKVGL